MHSSPLKTTCIHWILGIALCSWSPACDVSRVTLQSKASPIVEPPAYIHQGSVGTGTHATPGLPWWRALCPACVWHRLLLGYGPSTSLKHPHHNMKMQPGNRGWRRGGDDGALFQEGLMQEEPTFYSACFLKHKFLPKVNKTSQALQMLKHILWATCRWPGVDSSHTICHTDVPRSGGASC